MHEAVLREKVRAGMQEALLCKEAVRSRLYKAVLREEIETAE